MQDLQVSILPTMCLVPQPCKINKLIDRSVIPNKEQHSTLYTAQHRLQFLFVGCRNPIDTFCLRVGLGMRLVWVKVCKRLFKAFSCLQAFDYVRV